MAEFRPNSYNTTSSDESDDEDGESKGTGSRKKLPLILQAAKSTVKERATQEPEIPREPSVAERLAKAFRLPGAESAGSDRSSAENNRKKSQQEKEEPAAADQPEDAPAQAVHAAEQAADVSEGAAYAAAKLEGAADLVDDERRKKVGELADMDAGDAAEVPTRAQGEFLERTQDTIAAAQEMPPETAPEPEQIFDYNAQELIAVYEHPHESLDGQVDGEAADTEALPAEGEIELNPPLPPVEAAAAVPQSAEMLTPPPNAPEAEDAAGGSFGAGRGAGNVGGFGGAVPPMGPPSWATYNQAPSAPAVGPAAAELVMPEERPNHNLLWFVAGVFTGHFLAKNKAKKVERKLLSVQERLKEDLHNLQNRLLRNEEAVGRAASQAEARRQETLAVAPAAMRQPAEAAPRQDAGAVRAERPGAVPVSSPETPHGGRHTEQPVVQHEAPKRSSEAVQHMSPEEVRAAAREVRVGATDLEAVMSVGLVTEAGGRHVLEAFLRGGDFRRVLQEEMRNVEADESPERDPRLRHHGEEAEGQPAGQARGGETETNADTSAGQPIVGYDNTPMGVPGYLGQSQFLPHASMRAARPAAQASRTRSALVTANIAAFVVLVILLIVLLIVYL